MGKIRSYEELAPLLSAQLRPGVATNAAATREEYLRWIEGGELYAEPFDGGLYLLRQQEGFATLYFYLQRGGAAPALHWEEPTVLEIARRQRDAALMALDETWEAMGFQPRFTRLRLTRPAGPAPAVGTHPVRLAETADFDLIQALLRTHYDVRTSWQPSAAELMGDIAEGRVWLLENGGGFLHAVPAPGGFQVRHIAVDAALRRQGAAQSLLSAFLAQAGDRLGRVWIREDNIPSLKLFEKNGFSPDGWSAKLWLREL